MSLRAPDVDGDERDALARLRYAHGPGERRAALLALLLEPGNAAEACAWEAECAGLAGAGRWRDEVARLGPAARLPVFEALLERSRAAPQAERAALVEAARRVMGADGRVRPLDLLRWLVLRQRLVEALEASPAARPAAASEQAPAAVDGAAAGAAFGLLTHFLMRLLPRPPGGAVPGAAQLAWRERALEAAPDGTRDEAPRAGAAAAAPGAADGEGVLRAWRTLQAESWMRRPLRLRAWIDALPPPGPAALEPPAAEALCLCAMLLDVPRPPGLAARYRVAPLG